MKQTRALPWFLLASVAIHGAGFWGLGEGPETGRDLPRPKEKILELVPLPPAEEPLPLRKQVVDTPDLPAADQSPAEARFLAERNIRVDRETVGPLALRSPGRGGSGAPGAPAPPTTEPPVENAQEELKLGAKQLYPSLRDLWQMMPESGPGRIDHIEGVAEGEITALNTQEFRYAAFYNRVKQAVRAYWNPEPAVLRAGWPRHNLDTYLRFVADAEGRLLVVEVIHSCGYPAVDQAAVRALERAAPFYGVPKGLLNENGQWDEVFGFHIILR